MELIAILEPTSAPKSNQWYIISSDNSTEAPVGRVGHSATYLHKLNDSQSERIPTGLGDLHDGVILSGGANPDGIFAQTLWLDFSSLSWRILSTHDPHMNRYEHSVGYLSSQKSQQLVAFGGAQQDGPLASVVAWGSEVHEWNVLSPVSANPRAPMPRTHHTSCVVSADNTRWLLLFSGGHTGSEPVLDKQVYLLGLSSGTEDAACAWLHVNVRNEAPKPRSGHTLTCVSPSGQDTKTSSSVILHGGMAGTRFMADMHHLSLEWTFDAQGKVARVDGQWKELTPKNSRSQQRFIPCPRAAHAVVFLSSDEGNEGRLILFGGLSSQGALQDMYSFDLKTRIWTLIECQGSSIAPRLDFAYSLVIREYPVADEHADSRDAGSTEKIYCDLLFVHGGMDTEGNVFDDTCVFVLRCRVVKE